MAVIIPGKVLVLAHPRTASTVLRNALLERGATLINPHHVTVDDPQVKRVHAGEPILTVIRNPYDVMVSWWLVRTHNRPGYQPKLFEFIRGYRDTKGHLYRDGKLFYHAPAAKYVIRYERLQEDLNPALERCGVEAVTLGRSNPTGGKDKPWREFYDGDSIRAMNDRFGEEIVEYGYPLLS